MQEQAATETETRTKPRYHKTVISEQATSPTKAPKGLWEVEEERFKRQEACCQAEDQSGLLKAWYQRRHRHHHHQQQQLSGEFAEFGLIDSLWSDTHHDTQTHY